MDKDTLEGLLFIAAIIIIGGAAILKFCLEDEDDSPIQARLRDNNHIIMVPWCTYCEARVSEDHECPIAKGVEINGHI